jgi:hypothetical protein
VKEEKRRARKRIKLAHRKATDIQRVFRGWRDRVLLERMKRAGTILTSVARGFLVRLRLRKAESV